MAKKATVVAKVKLTDGERMTQKADKTVASVLELNDAASFNLFAARVAAVAAVLNQDGDGAGKRFNGSASHDFADNATAYVDTVRRGNIPKIA